MANSEKLNKLSGDYDQWLESLIPASTPPASSLMEKREKKDSISLNLRRLGMAYAFLIVVFASISLFMINSLRYEPMNENVQILNTAIFSTDHPGSVVTAFREVTK